MFTNKIFADKLIKRISQHRILIFLFIIVLFGACLRFWGYPARYGFDIDATRDAILTQYAAANNLWPLIGPVSALGSFNFGPWYYYQLIFFQHLFPFVYSSWIYISLISVLVIIVMYAIGKDLFNKEFGLMLALLTAVSPGQIIAGTGLSNPDLVSFFAAVSIWLFVRLLKFKASALSAFLMGLSIGIGINCHYQMVYFVFLPFLLFVFCKTGKVKILLFSLFGIFISFIPLIIFNLTHHFQTVSGLMDYYIYGKNKVYVPNRWLLYLFNFWPQFWGYVFGFPSLAGLIIGTSATLVSLALIIKRKVSVAFGVPFLFFIICFIFLRFFSGERASYYLLFFHPFLIMFTGVLLWQLLKIRFGKILFGILLMLFLIAGLRIDIDHTQSVYSRAKFVSQVKTLESIYPNRKFSIFACKGQYKDQIQAVIFLINNNNKLGSDVKLGFKDAHCTYPVGILENSKLNAIGAVDLTSFSLEQLKSYGYTYISPAYLYSSLLDY